MLEILDSLLKEFFKNHINSDSSTPYANAIYKISKIYPELNELDLIIIERLLLLEREHKHFDEEIPLDLLALCDLVFTSYSYFSIHSISKSLLKLNSVILYVRTSKENKVSLVPPSKINSNVDHRRVKEHYLFCQKENEQVNDSLYDEIIFNSETLNILLNLT